jgi:hypothetical protein
MEHQATALVAIGGGWKFDLTPVMVWLAFYDETFDFGLG